MNAGNICEHSVFNDERSFCISISLGQVCSSKLLVLLRIVRTHEQSWRPFHSKEQELKKHIIRESYSYKFVKPIWRRAHQWNPILSTQTLKLVTTQTHPRPHIRTRNCATGYTDTCPRAIRTHPHTLVYDDKHTRAHTHTHKHRSIPSH